MSMGINWDCLGIGTTHITTWTGFGIPGAPTMTVLGLEFIWLMGMDWRSIGTLMGLEFISGMAFKWESIGRLMVSVVTLKDCIEGTSTLDNTVRSQGNFIWSILSFSSTLVNIESAKNQLSTESCPIPRTRYFLCVGWYKNSHRLMKSKLYGIIFMSSVLQMLVHLSANKLLIWSQLPETIIIYWRKFQPRLTVFFKWLPLPRVFLCWEFLVNHEGKLK